MPIKENHYRLDSKEYDGLLEAERQLTAILPDIDAAESCGIECQEYRRQHREALDQIQMIKLKFGPESALSRQ